MEHSIEIIFREAAKALGQIASQKLMTDVFKEEEVVKPKKAAAPKKEAAPADGAPRWTRWTKTHTEAFKKNLAAVDLNPEDKEFDKLKKEFVKYLNELTEDDYHKDGKTHLQHMNDFVHLKKAPKKAEEKPVEKKEKKTMWEDMHETPRHPPASAGGIEDVDLKELQGNDFLITVDGSPDGVYWDGSHGRWVRGPCSVEDEDLIEKKLNGVEYMVGEQSGRVYQEVDDRDTFVGYVGIGKFKDMKMP